MRPVILRGEIRADAPLLVLAVQEEAAHLGDDLPVLLTGMGKVNAATAVATVLASGPKPSLVLNLGTAGALRPGWAGLHEIGTVLQHDLDTELLRTLTGQVYGAPLTLGTRTAVLATGDTFVADEDARARLARRADLVDMEGYAVAWAAARAGVPCRMVKRVSDEAGEGADRAWRDAVDDCARDLAAWVRHELP
ncbi:nucleoside phosphorylase [Micromonospora globbae]|jgi:adenosylhomocysteine nucleosidase|uniref:Nucleoside phosphorylase n=1 Tax=Micromonospora globbae TaxID=1894969 RepID=A0A420F836_9ACTN|nr:nucleoside phosphorylase [Micromonospora globbae]